MEKFPNTPSPEEKESDLNTNSQNSFQGKPLRSAAEIAIQNLSTTPERFRKEAELRERGRDILENTKYQNFENIDEHIGKKGFERYESLLGKSEEELTADELVEIGLLEKFLESQTSQELPEDPAGKKTETERPEGAENAESGESSPEEPEDHYNDPKTFFSEEDPSVEEKEGPSVSNEDETEKIKLSLSEARRAFVESEFDLERNWHGKVQRVADVEEAERLAHIEESYREALKNERLKAISGARDLEGREEVFYGAMIEYTVNEAMRLSNLRTEVKLEKKPEKVSGVIKNNLIKVERWYRKLPLKTKLLIAGGLFASAGAGAALGGVVGASLAGAALTGKTAQRILSGAGVSVLLEGKMKSAQESAERRSMERAFGRQKAEDLLAMFEGNNTKLNNAMLRLESSQNRRKVRRYVLAATAGGLLASGLVGKAIQNIAGDKLSELGKTVKEKLGIKDAVTETEALPADGRPEIGVEGEGGEMGTFIDPEETPLRSLEPLGVEAEVVFEAHSVAPGETMYSVIKDNFPEISNLEGQAQANAIENILAVIKENPTEYGISSGKIDLLSVGDKVDIGKINDILNVEKINSHSILERARQFLEGFSGEGEGARVSQEGVAASGATDGAEQISTVDAEVDNLTPESNFSGGVNEVTESVRGRLDNLFLSASAENVHSGTTPEGAYNISGTIRGEDYLNKDMASRSIIRMIQAGELSSEDFIKYLQDNKVIGMNSAQAQVIERSFELIQDPSSAELGRTEINMAGNRIRGLVDRLWLEKSK